MLILLATLAAQTPVAPPVSPPLSPQACPNDYRIHQAAAPGPHRLDKTPKADLVLTVYREVGKCPAPVIVRSGEGTVQR